MKFLTFSDTHQDVKALKALMKRAQEDDIEFLICAGDLSIFGRGLREGLSMLNSVGKKVYFIPGNHEDGLKGLPELLKEFSHLEDLHKKAVLIRDYVFLGYGGDGFSQRDAVFRKLAREWYGQFNGKKTVFVAHGPAYGTKVDEIEGRNVGSFDFRKFVERIQPKIMISGHLHETAGVVDKIDKTRIVNPGWDGMVIELK